MINVDLQNICLFSLEGSEGPMLVAIKPGWAASHLDLLLQLTPPLLEAEFSLLAVPGPHHLDLLGSQPSPAGPQVGGAHTDLLLLLLLALGIHLHCLHLETDLLWLGVDHWYQLQHLL